MQNQFQEQPVQNIHKTSQNHKTPLNEYQINPKNIPRPCTNNEIFLKDKSSVYETSIESLPPLSLSKYIVKETENTSCRFLRSSLNAIPTTQSLLSQTVLPFSIYLQPFAEIDQNEEQIPKVETEGGIFRCKQCKSYINSKYVIKDNYPNKIAVCNICEGKTEIEPSNPGFKNSYFSNDFSDAPELLHPTIDYIAPEKFNVGNKEFTPHYIFLLDISEKALSLNLPSYILNSIQSNLDYFHNGENSYIAIGLYDEKCIYFFYIEKNDIKISIVGDLKDSFSPLGIQTLYLKISSQRDEIERIFEKLNSIITERTANLDSAAKSTQSAPTASAIKAGVDSLLENGGRVMVFTASPCSHGYAACQKRSVYNKEKEPEKSDIFHPQHDVLNSLAELANNNAIVVDQFIFGSKDYDLATLSSISNLTGGGVYYYPYSSEDTIMNSYYEKLHYDITRIVTRPNYYDTKFMIRFSLGIDCIEMLGPFNKKLGEAFQLGGCDPDYSFVYNLRLNDTFKKNQKIHFQIVCLFVDNFGQRYLRMFNSTFLATDEVEKIYGKCDVDSLTKSMIMKEILLTYRTDINKVRQNIEDRIIDSFKFYRVKERPDAETGSLVFPIALKFLPLYLNSFIKKRILSKTREKYDSNELISRMIQFMRDPVYFVIKNLYPKFYQIDDIQKDQTLKYQASNATIIKDVGMLNEKTNMIQKPYLLRLSKDSIDFDCSYIIDDGEFLTVLVFDQMEGEFYYDLFGVSTFDDCKKNAVSLETITENQSDLLIRVNNIINQLREENSGRFQPLRLFFISEGGIYKQCIESLMVEDDINNESNYSSFLFKIYGEINKKMGK